MSSLGPELGDNVPTYLFSGSHFFNLKDVTFCTVRFVSGKKCNEVFIDVTGKQS